MPRPEPLALPHPVAFAFSGGTALGSIQVGMLRALLEHDIAPDLLVGSSAGAINAAFLGGGISAARLTALEEVWSKVRASDIFGSGIGRLRAVLARGALAFPAGLREILERNLAPRHGDLAIPTAVVATDLLSGDPVVLEDGDLRRNVLASAAIPGLFPPVEVDGRTLADGGLSAQVPVLQATGLGAASVVVLDAGYPCALGKRPRGLIENVVHAASLVLRHQAVAALRAVGPDVTVLYLPSPCPLGVPPWDFRHWAELIEKGYRSASRFLADVGRVGPGIHGHPHFHAPGSVDALHPPRCSEEEAEAPAPVSAASR